MTHQNPTFAAEKTVNKGKKMRKVYLPIMAAFAALTLAACGGKQVANDGTGRETVEMSGAGATFPLPFYTMTFESYTEKVGDQVSYGGIGSGSPGRTPT